MDRPRPGSHTAQVIIRREHPRDHDAVRAVHLAAFTRDPVSGAVRSPEDVVEARLVDRLREDAGFLPHLSLVAELDGVVTGHVLVTRAWLEPAGAPVLGLGPLGVLPEAQGGGVGTALVHSVLAVAEAAGETLVALLGDPAYYGRFGFRAAEELGVRAPEPVWGRHFQARWLAGPRTGGTFRYADPFQRL